MHRLSQWALLGHLESTLCLPAHWHYQSSELCRQSSPVKIKHAGRFWIHTACRPAPCVRRLRSASGGGPYSPCLMVVDGKPSRWMGKRRCNYPLVPPLPGLLLFPLPHPHPSRRCHRSFTCSVCSRSAESRTIYHV